MSKVKTIFYKKINIKKAGVLMVALLFIIGVFVPAVNLQVKTIKAKEPTNENIITVEKDELKTEVKNTQEETILQNDQHPSERSLIKNRINNWFLDLIKIFRIPPSIQRLWLKVLEKYKSSEDNILLDNNYNTKNINQILISEPSNYNQSNSKEKDISINQNKEIQKNDHNILSLDLDSGDPWWDTGWDYRKEVTIDHSKVTGTLTNFPVLISLSGDSNLALFAQADGDDIVFTNQTCTTVYNHEIDYYNSGTLQAWVNVTSLSSTTDTFLYMYFGNATCLNQENPTGVWDSSFVMVQHMQETSGTHYDSTSNNNDATEYITPDSNMDTSGKIAGADYFDTGGDDYLEVTGDLVTGDGNTISFWEYEMTIGTGFGCIIDDFSTGGFLWQFGTTTTFQIGSVDSWGYSWTHGGLVDGTWHHYTATLSGGTISVYENGSLVDSQSYGTTVAADGQDVRIMGRSDGNYATGKLDELRISNTVRSADWIQTSYNNQYEPDSFFDVGPLEPPLPWWNSEWQYRKEITIDNTKVAGDLTNFPTLISLTGDSDLAANAQSNGEDIVFVDQNGLKLDHEIEYYNAGDLDCWVELPSLFESSDTVLYMYYGNGTCLSQENPSGVWDTNFVMVQHMQETSGTHFDSTSNNNDATEYITPDSNMDTSGIIAGADFFDTGADDYLQISGDLVSGDGNTISFWEYNMTIASGYGCVFDDWSGSSGLLWQFGDLTTDFQVGNVGDWTNNLVYTHGGLVDDTWHYYTVTLEDNHIRLYEDGSLVAFKTHNTNVAADTDNVQIMRRSDGHYTTGKMDELRVSNVNRSADWIETCYMNQYEPDSFFDIGDVEIFGMGLPPVVSEESPADAAVDVSVGLTSLSFKLNDTDSDLMNYTVETIPNIGSGGVNEVPNGTYSVSVSGLSPFTTYVWYVNVTDGNYDVNESYSFTTETLSVFDPSICGWGYQKKITIDHSLVSDTLSNFPVLIDITDSDLSSHAQTDGDDIVFMDACGNANLLAHEIELFDGGSGHLVAWVNVPSVFSASDTELYMYYGNPTSSNVEDKTGVWANGYELVVHHNEASGLVYDSTSNGYTGSKVGGVTQNVAGKSAGGDHFDGTSSYLSFGDVCDITSGGATWSLWVNHDSTKAHRYFGKGAGGILVQWFWSVGPPEQAHIEVGNVGDWGGRATFVTPQDSGNWHYLTYVFDDSDSKYKIYLDGSFGVMGPASSLPVDNGDSFVIGSGYIHESYAFTNGTIDETRVSSSVRNASWIATCYNNQYTPSGFYSVSDEMSAGAPDVSDPVPGDGAIGVSTSITQLEFTISDCQGDSMTYVVGTVPDVGGGGSGGSVSDGTYNVPVSGLASFTTYTWYVNVSDGTNYNNVSYTFSTMAAASFDPSLYGWQYQRQLIIDHSNVADDLTDYPLLVSMVDADLGAHARSDGRDIIFMAGCGGSASLLDYEIETFDYTTGELVAWVRIPSLSSSVDTELFMFYGKADAPPLENASGVWDSNYMMVQHLEETSGVHYDSTSNDYDGTKAGGVTQGATGKINDCDHLDGTGYVSFGDVCDITSGGATWSCWVKLDLQGIHRIIGKGSTGLLIQWYNASGSSQLQAGYVGPGSANWSENVAVSVSQDTEWHLFTTVFNDTSSKYEIFFDGVFLAEGTEGDLPVDNGDSFVLGSGYTHDYPMTGYVDEFRVSDVKRSSVWIATCYANQDDPGGFVRIGGETAAGAPVISDMDPMDGATAVSATLSQLSFSLADCQGDTMTYTVESLPNIGSGGGTVSDGLYNVPISGLQYETTYTWFVNVTDGTNWNNETFTFTTRPMILLSNPSPLDDGVWALYNPMLEVEVDHDAAAPLTIRFLTNASGSWEEIYSYTNSGGGIYTARSSGMTTREKRFFWRVNASDGLGNFSEETFDFYMVHFVGDAITPVARSFCCKFGYIGRARETGIAYVTTQQADHPGPYGLPEDIPHYAKYDINQGWVETYEFLFNSGNAFHPFWGYWGDEYHFAHGQGGGGCKLADSPTWEGFQSMDFHSVWYTVGPRSDTNPTPSCYSFDNDNAWIISSDEGYHVMKYWPWNESTGWGSPVSIEATRTGLNLDAGQILQINKTTWLLYYAQCSGADILYVKTTDAGQTWSGPFDPSIPTTTSSCNRVSFAQYGKNYYMFVTDGGAVIYNSTDGENWANRQVIYSGGSIVHHGCLLHQSALISTHGGSGDPSDQYGILTIVDEMMSDPDKPSGPYPADEAMFSLGTTSTTLSVTVQGNQVYDIAFYWANGTFIGEEKLLEEGDVASVTVSGLTDNIIYEWYAVCRGATGIYAGYEPFSTSDENRTDIYQFSVGVTEAPRVTNENPGDGSFYVPVSQSQLSFSLSDDQGDPMTYTVTSVPDIGSNSATVGNGTYNVPITGLNYATLYTWHVNVSDGTHWTNKTFTFTTELETTFNPFAKGWSYRKKIVIDHMKVTTDLTNFPVLVNVTDGDLASKAEIDGSDIMFMDGSGVANRLNHEIEYYDGGSGYLVAWVNVTSVSSSIDTEFYMYYGKATVVSYENVVGVWDSSYKMVHHLNETSGTHYDSTSYSNDGTCSGGVDQSAVGIVDGADRFDPTDQYIQGTTFSLSDQYTVGMWFKANNLTDWHTLFEMGDVSTNRVYFWLQDDEIVAVGHKTSSPWTGTTNADLVVDQWYHAVFTFDYSASPQIRLYIDGNEVALTANTGIDHTPSLAGNWRIGNDMVWAGEDYTFNGTIDEVRISNPVRSAGWINASYMNQHNPAGFCSVESEENSNAPVVSSPVPADGATGVSVSLENLTFTIMDYQGDPMTYTVTTVPDIGSDSATVGNGTYNVSVSGLAYGTLYTWYVNVTDGTKWTNKTYTFTSERAPGSWYNDEWPFRKEITIDHNGVSADLYNFPVLIHIIDSDLTSKAQPDGDDLIFTDYYGSKLHHEIEYYDDGTGELVAWVNVTSLSGSIDTVLYMYYGNFSCTNQENPSGVWDSSYKMVHHLHETSGTHYDSTSYGNDGTPHDGLNQNTVGKIDGADDFDGTDDGIICSHDISLSITDKITYEAWLNPDYLPTSKYWNLLIKGQTDPTNYQFYIEQNTGYFGYFDSYSAFTAGVAVTPSAWQHIAISVNSSSSTVSFYKNGALVLSSSGATFGPTNTDIMEIGDYKAGVNPFDGRMDEIRLSNKDRSSEWIATEYNNQNNPSGFYSVGGEETLSGAPIVSNPVPANGAINVLITLSNLSFSLTDNEGDPMTYTVTTTPDIGSGGATVGNGTYNVSISGLALNTMYTWYVNVTDGTSWSNKTYYFTTQSNILITLNVPLNNTVTRNNMPGFTFTVQSPEPVVSCTLYLQLTSGGSATAYGTDNSVQNGVSTVITPSSPIPNGEYWWWIYYTDGTNTSNSEKRKITIDVYRGDRSFTASWDGSTQYYWLNTPDGYDDSTPTPLVIYLHGYGQSRTSFASEFPDLRDLYQENGWIVFSPEGRVVNGYEIWYNETGRSDITDILNIMKSEFNINESRIHIHGRSMGGTGTLQYTIFNENVIASMVDIHGIPNITSWYNWNTNPTYAASLEQAFGGTPTEVPEVYANNSAIGNEYHFRNTPVYIIHGTADPQIPVDQSRALNQSLSALGYTVRYDEVLGGPHNPPSIVWGREQDIFDWFNDHPLDLGAPDVTLNLPDDNYWSLDYPVAITFNATATSTEGDLVNMSLYITDSNNMNFGLYQTTPVTGLVNTTTWTVVLSKGTYTWNVLAYDNKSSSGWGTNRTLILDDDTTPPTWDVLPSNQTVPYGSAFVYDVDASDNVAVDSYFIDDTINFTINAATGLIQNNTLLSVGIYELIISVNDTSDNINSAGINVTVLGPGGWWNGGWKYRKEITIDHSKVSDDLVNFPVLVSFTDGDLISKAQDNGDDIVFTDYYGSKLHHEIEYYDDGTGELVAWVNVTSLSSSINTILYMYYGNPSCNSQQNVPDVWDSDYRMVQHLNETSGTHYDSTSYNNDGTTSGGLNQNVVGMIDGADDFDGSDDGISCNDDSSLDITDYLTFEIWVHPDTISSSHYTSLIIKGASDPVNFQIYLAQSTGILGYYDGSSADSSGVAISTGAWQHIVVSVNDSSSTVNFYMNGNLIATQTGTVGPHCIGSLQIGAFIPQDNYFDGIIDEVRLSEAIRSPEWISTQYNNQNDTSSFYSIGSEETGSGTPVITSPSPPDSVSDISVSLSLLSVLINDTEGDSFNWSIETNPNIGSSTSTNEYNGTKTCSISGLVDGTTYTWFVNATDSGSGDWTRVIFTFTTETVPGGWWNTDWNYRKNITLNHSQVAEDLSNFPVLIRTTDIDLISKAQDDGDDLVFTDYYGNKLNHEIEYFDSISGNLVAWVNVTSLSSSVNTTLFMYYGNLICGNQENVPGVWDSSHKLVQHLEETSGTHYDSTSYGHDGTITGGVNQSAVGIVDGADSFTYIEQYVQGTSFSLSDEYTVGMWFKPNTLEYPLPSGNWSCLFEMASSGSSRILLWSLDDELYVCHDTAVVTTNADLVAGQWHYGVFTFDYSASPQAHYYINGNEVSLTKNTGIGHTPSLSGGIWRVGTDTFQAPDHTFNGTIDEVRISNPVRSHGWINTSYLNQFDPDSFFDVGFEETVPDEEITVDISLEIGWNLITIPVNNSWYASDIVANVTDCDNVVKWDPVAQSYWFYIPGFPAFDFPLENGVGYFVDMNTVDTLSVSGMPIEEVNVQLNLGWNLLGWYNETDTTASSLAENISGCNNVVKWDPVAQSYWFYIPGFPAFDFTISRGMGVFVEVSSTSIWHGEG